MKFEHASFGTLSAPLLALTAALAGCGGTPETTANNRGPNNDDLETGNVREAVINGTPWGGWNDGRELKVIRSGTGLCTGTLLRPDIVLTAKHCLHPNGWVDQTSGFVPASQLTVASPVLGTTSNVTSYQVLNSPNLEVAVLKLTTALWISGFTQFTGFSGTQLQGQGLWCSGFGNSAATQAQCQNNFGGTGIGALRGHWNTPSSLPANRMTFTNNGSNQNRASGDSGSTCYHQTGAGDVWEATDVLGWYSSGATCVAYGTQWGPSGVDGVDPASSHTFVTGQISTLQPNTFDPFDGNTLAWYSVVDPVTPVNGPSSWTWQSAGHSVFQSSSMYQYLGADLDGTKLIFPWRAHATASVSALVVSNTNISGAGAGVVTRFHDQTHFYQFTVQADTQTGRFAKRKGSNGYTNVQSWPLPAHINWSSSVFIEVSQLGCNFSAYVNGLLVGSFVDTSCDYMDGFGGMITVDMPAVFDQFQVWQF